jgi:RNA-directed DNA polymerase
MRGVHAGWVLSPEKGDSGRRRYQATLLHHVNEKLLLDSFYLLKKQAAPGVDRVTWGEYEEGVEARIPDLHDRIHRGALATRSRKLQLIRGQGHRCVFAPGSAQPSRRVYIPKPDGRRRPLGIAALEDKIVQQAVVEVLNQIYEGDFAGFSYGFRPGRSAHGALDSLGPEAKLQR